MSDQIVKNYKAYLTRRSKWEAIRACQSQSMVGAVALRDTMVRLGERPDFLTEAWRKKVLGDTKLFEPSGDGFFVLTDEAEEISLGKRPQWSGERPGEDWVRSAYDQLTGRVSEMEAEDFKGAVHCLDSKWDDTAEAVIAALESLKDKGVEKPLGKLWSVAWEECLRTTVQTNPKAQQVALWMLRAMAEVDAYTRVRAYLKGGERPLDVLGPEDGHGALHFPPIVFKANKDHDGSPQGVLEDIRHRLVRRGIMKERA